MKKFLLISSDFFKRVRKWDQKDSTYRIPVPFGNDTHIINRDYHTCAITHIVQIELLPTAESDREKLQY